MTQAQHFLTFCSQQQEAAQVGGTVRTSEKPFSLGILETRPREMPPFPQAGWSHPPQPVLVAPRKCLPLTWMTLAGTEWEPQWHKVNKTDQNNTFKGSENKIVYRTTAKKKVGQDTCAKTPKGDYD